VSANIFGRIQDINGMKRRPSYSGFLFGACSGVVVAIYIALYTIFNLPKDATFDWFVGGVLSLGIAFFIQGVFHGLGAGIAIEYSQRMKFPYTDAFYAVIGSLCVSSIEYLFIRYLFTDKTGNIIFVALFWTCGYAVFFGIAFRLRAIIRR